MRRAVSTLSVALILQDLEERIPWGAVRDSDGCDWALVRPAWIEAISDGPSLQTLAAAVATLEGVLDEKAFDAKWAGKGRDGWLRRLVEATEAAEVLPLVQELEKALRWDDLEDLDSDEEEGEGEGEGEEAAGEEEEPANDGRRGAAKAADKAIKRGPGRPPKRDRPSGGAAPKAKKAKEDEKKGKKGKEKEEPKEPPKEEPKAKKAKGAKELSVEAPESPAKASPRIQPLDPAAAAAAADNHRASPRFRGGGGGGGKEPPEEELPEAAAPAKAKAKSSTNKSGKEKGAKPSRSTRVSKEEEEPKEEEPSPAKEVKEEEKEEGEGEGEGENAVRTRRSLRSEALLSEPAKDSPAKPKDEDDEEDDDSDDDDGELGTLASFHQRAAAYKNEFFREQKRGAPTYEGGMPGDVDVAPSRVEETFWKLVEGELPGEKRALDVTHNGVACGDASAFPAAGDAATAAADEPEMDYGASPWAPARLAAQSGSLLSHLPAPDRAAAAPALLRCGMLFSCSGWMTAPCFLHSLCHHHAGAPRTWYALSAADAEALQEHALRELPDAARSAREVAFRLPALLSPTSLCSSQLQVSRLVQYPGELVLVAPRAFHATVCHGFTVTTTAPFASAEWLPRGRAAAALHRELRTPPPLCFEQAVVCATRGDESVRTAVALQDELRLLVAAHTAQLKSLKELGVAVRPLADAPPGAGMGEPPAAGAGSSDDAAASAAAACGGLPRCSESAQPCFFLFVTTAANPKVATSAAHVAALGAPPKECVAYARFSAAELAELQQLLEARLAKRAKWLEEAEAALETAPKLGDVHDLLQRATSMQIDLEEKSRDQLAKRAAIGEEWQRKAEAMQASREVHDIEAVERLLGDAEEIDLELPAEAELKALLGQVRTWQRKAQQVPKQQSGRWQPERTTPADELRGLLDADAATRLKVPEIEILRTELSRLEWVEKAEAMLAGEPLLDDLRELLDDADELDLAHLHVGVALTKRCGVASKWAQRANNALRRRTGLSALEALRAEATSGANSAGMGVRLEQLEEVDTRIAGAQAFVARAKAALARSTAVELRELKAAGEALDVTVAEEEQVASRVKSIDWWLKRASQAFLKRGCGATLLGVLTGEEKQRDAGGEAEDEEGSTAGLPCAYCTGNETQTLGKYMIGCDDCDGWFHGPCVGVGKQAAETIDRVRGVCPACATKKGAKYAFGPPMPAPRHAAAAAQVRAHAARRGVGGARRRDGGGAADRRPRARRRGVARARAGAAGGRAIDANALDVALDDGETCEVEAESIPPLRKLRAQFVAWRVRAAHRCSTASAPSTSRSPTTRSSSRPAAPRRRRRRRAGDGGGVAGGGRRGDGGRRRGAAGDGAGGGVDGGRRRGGEGRAEARAEARARRRQGGRRRGRRRRTARRATRRSPTRSPASTCCWRR